MIKVENMYSPNGNPVANQFIIRTSEGRYFQSYDSIIAFIPNEYGKPVLLGNDWDYSVTTGKYRNQFLGMNKKELLALIDRGGAVFADLDEFGIPDKDKFRKGVEKLVNVREGIEDIDALYSELEKLVYGE